ncbi:uncharacterized protein LOC124644570 [Helicoverpa zea]|uniref:uncharacterized protein LOC124644570 n=1 Tax=Helicoverpa zea TaxID=7113 RepID=UPI001F584768|nr:uncharacterized protein LOC124644570 [Helicoverpa zea]
MSITRTPPKLFVSDPDLSTRGNDSSNSPLNVTMRNYKRARLIDDVGGVSAESPLEDTTGDIRELIKSLIAQQNIKFEAMESSIREIKEQYLSITSMENNILDIKVQNSDIQTVNKEIIKNVDFISSQMKDIENKICKLEGERNNYNAQIHILEDKIETMERNSRKTCIEIRGVPKKSGESKQELYQLISSASGAIKTVLSESQIKDVYRLPSRENVQTSTVVAEFTNTLVKENFLKAAKKYNNENRNNELNTIHLGLPGPAAAVYISENLTAKTKRLLFLARDLAKVESYQYCWVSNGRVFLRKKQGAPSILIKNENSFLKLKQSDQPTAGNTKGAI